ncbi:ABC transporter ATP-binding protein [bacterium]|nr:ABC transporter ATP-binding protein [bacterium]
MSLLKLEGVTVAFGGLLAVSNFDLEVNDKELVGLIGPNGAGKTTVFNVITGFHIPIRGKITFTNINITGKSPSYIAKLGISRTFQNIRLFPNLTVLENVMISAQLHFNISYLHTFFRTPLFYKVEKSIEEKALRSLELVGLKGVKDETAKNLPYGDQRKLEIARAIATEPRLILLDEPAAGMNPRETDELMKMIKFLRDELDLTIILIEHDMRVVMNICERVVVLNYGEIIAEGTPNEIKTKPEVLEAYLGSTAVG